jgi:hypothetical protein
MSVNRECRARAGLIILLNAASASAQGSGASTRRPELLAAYPEVQVLYRPLASRWSLSLQNLRSSKASRSERQTRRSWCSK